MTNIFTVDVEEYYHAENICRSLPPEKLKGLPDRVEIGMNMILELLARYRSHATFFVLGCVAEKNRQLIKRIADEGHEIASHGYLHMPLTMHTPQSFDEDLGRSVKLLEDITGTKVLGYRATSFSLGKGMGWFFDILRKHGIRYDSSVALSLFRPHELTRSTKGCPYEIAPGILEFPVSTLSLGPLRLPVGGGYFRLYPLWMTKLAMSQAASRGEPFVFYLHPWELDPDQPRISLPVSLAFRHCVNLSSSSRKAEKLLSGLKFGSCSNFREGLKAR